MANNRITWQNVAAPDLGDALTGVGLSGDLFAAAASRFQGAMNGFDSNRKDRVSAKAMDTALRIGDAQNFDAALQGQGLAAFGVAPEDATPELMNFILGRRAALTGAASDDISLNQQAHNLTADQWSLDRRKELAPHEDARNAQILREGDQSFKQGELNYEQDVYGFGRTKITDGRADKTYAQGEADLQRQAEALQRADQIARNAPTAEAAERMIQDMQLDPLADAATRAALGQQPETRWSIDSKVAGTSGLLPEFAVAGDALDARKRQLNTNLSNNPVLDLYQQGTAAAQGYTDPAAGMVARLRGTMDPGDPESESVLSKSYGELKGVHDSLTTKYPNIPRQIITAVMENNLGKDGFLGIGDSTVSPNMRQIHEELKRLDKPGAFKNLDAELSQVKREQLEIKEFEDAMTAEQAKYEWAISNNRPQVAQQALTNIQNLGSVWAGAKPHFNPRKAGQPVPRPQPQGAGPLLGSVGMIPVPPAVPVAPPPAPATPPRNYGPVPPMRKP